MNPLTFVILDRRRRTRASKGPTPMNRTASILRAFCIVAAMAAGTALIALSVVTAH